MRISDGKYGVTKYGFRRKLYSEALQERITRAKRVFGVNIDTSETSFLGKFIRNAAWDEAILWEEIEKVYKSAFVGDAEGSNLDGVGQYLTITRRPAVKAKGTVKFTGRDDTLIPAGFRVGTPDGRLYETVETFYIKSGSVEVAVRSIGAGKKYNANIGEVTEIINPTFGIESVENLVPIEGGLDLETDEEFRERYKKSYSRGGGSTLPALTAAILDIDDVVDAEIRENTSMETIDGIPPKSVACFVFGGTDDEIAETIYKNKPAGIQAFGEIVKNIEDTKGNRHRIGFTRARTEEIYLKVSLKKGEDYKGDEAVKRAIINYIGGTDSDGIAYNGLKLGKDVILSKVIGAMMCLGGVDDVVVTMGKDKKSLEEKSIEIDRQAIARTRPENIEIAYV